MSEREYVEIDYLLFDDMSRDAYKFFDEGYEVVWVPKSVVKTTLSWDDTGKLLVIEVERWFAEQEELI